jgi:dTDP-4-dehydrorhamnose 3,5-epimerase
MIDLGQTGVWGHLDSLAIDDLDMLYAVTRTYDPDDEHGVAWNDPSIAIAWPVTNPLLSERDRAYRPLSADRTDLPQYRDNGR